MPPEVLETRAHTTAEGILHLDLNVGVADVDVTVVVRIVPTAATAVDANGWPQGFFEQVAGSMPDLERPPQGEFEERPTLE
jgi:hypothetical protein